MQPHMREHRFVTVVFEALPGGGTTCTIQYGEEKKERPDACFTSLPEATLYVIPKVGNYLGENALLLGPNLNMQQFLPQQPRTPPMPQHSDAYNGDYAGTVEEDMPRVARHDGHAAGMREHLNGMREKAAGFVAFAYCAAVWVLYRASGAGLA